LIGLVTTLVNVLSTPASFVMVEKLGRRAILIYISVFATTWGPSAWIVIGEIFPLTIRSRGVGLSTGKSTTYPQIT
jgi:hypothetical protein